MCCGYFSRRSANVSGADINAIHRYSTWQQDFDDCSFSSRYYSFDHHYRHQLDTALSISVSIYLLSLVFLPVC